MNSDDLKGTGESRTEQEEEEYSFLNETVKDPPVNYRKILMKISMLTGAAILFGVVAALVFCAVAGRRTSMTPNPVSIPPDEQVAFADGDSASEDLATDASGENFRDNSAGDGRAGSEMAGRMDGEDAAGTSFAHAGSDGSGQAETSPPPTEEELDREALNTYARVGAEFRRIAEGAFASVVTVTGVTADDEWFDITNAGLHAASGLVVADNSVSYLILTNADILANADRIAVTLPDGCVAEAQLQKEDPVTGLCVIAIPREDVPGKSRSQLSVAVLGNSYNLKQGDSVLAVGAPTGTDGTYCCGRIISLDRTIEIVDGEYRLVTTDMYGGSEGTGILINLDGEAVGIIAQQYADGSGHSVTAIPISPIKSLIEKMSNNASLSYLGIHGLDISEKAAEAMDIPSGVYVSSVEEGSPVNHVGVQPGDIITMVGGSSAVTLRSLHEIVMSRSPGDNLDIVVMRQGSSSYAEFDFSVTIGELPETEAVDAASLRSAEADDSASVRNVEADDSAISEPEQPSASPTAAPEE
ncbi:MAG: trypsin-like peptidase domain-containing protein [Lachnospiraceae bacterium]|nr:trypsin-like peptidase domain-containing protein [Lachnospiraceae bacterium]